MKRIEDTITNTITGEFPLLDRLYNRKYKYNLHNNIFIFLSTLQYTIPIQNYKVTESIEYYYKATESIEYYYKATERIGYYK